VFDFPSVLPARAASEGLATSDSPHVAGDRSWSRRTKAVAVVMTFFASFSENCLEIIR